MTHLRKAQMSTVPAPTYSDRAMTEAFSVAVDQLERFLSRLCRNDAILQLERESPKWWIVVDLANHEQVMCRADRGVCERFMAAFIVKHPEARIASSGSGEPMNDAGTSSAGVDAHTSPVSQVVLGEPASPLPGIVVPIREGVA